jgi:long-chain fatty acid transport protein
MSKVGVITIAPAAAYKISDAIMIGASLNINYAMFDISTWAGMPEVMPGVFFDMGQQEMSLTGWGYGATFGVMVKPSEMFSVGVTYRTPTSIKFKGDTMIENLDVLGQMLTLTVPDTSEAETEVTWPMWVGVGVAFFPIDNLTITADFQYTQWSKIEKIDLAFAEQLWAVFLPADATAIDMSWEDSSQVRLGVEYKLNKLALRGGFYFDPAPAPDMTMNVLLPSFDFTVITAGLGYALDGLKIDFAVEYLMGKDRNVPFLIDGVEPEQPGKYTMSIIAPTLSVSYGW